MKYSTICHLEKDGKMLFLHRNKKENDMHEGKWVGIGGKFEKGESPEECVIREFLEETGLSISNPKMHGVIIFPDFFQGEDWMTFVFSCNDYTGEMIDSPEGTLKWVDISEVSKLEMWEGDYLFLEWMRENEFFSAKMVYEDQKMIFHEVNKYKF